MSKERTAYQPSGGGGMLKKTLISAMLGALLVPVMQAEAASVAAKASYKNNLFSYSGKAKGLAVDSQVSVFDAETGILLHSSRTNSKNIFKYTLPLSEAPCSVRIEAAGVNAVFKVKGAPAASCKAAPTCKIATPAGNYVQVTEGQPVSFEAGKLAKGVNIGWNFGDQASGALAGNVIAKAIETDGATASHTYSKAGSYRVIMVGEAAGKQCQDDLTVAVVPSADANPNAKVAEKAAPAVAAAMPQGSSTGEHDIVVLPFEETGMQGGSQVNLPYNAMINYNSLNAQVIQKERSKPPLKTHDDVDVVYSAASNPKDPVGADSINSTSQNLFADNSKGANVDLNSSKVDATTQTPTENVFLDGHDYIDAKIRKTEHWDRFKQTKPGNQTGFDFPWQQNRFSPAKPLAEPDEGVRGSVDMGEGVRKMPGIDAPYVNNTPQSFDYNSVQTMFTSQFIPITDVDDKGRTNPYPLLRVEAKTKGTDTTVAKADAVYTTASETRCRECHLPGGIAANEDVWRRPVTESEKLAADGISPGPATGAGEFSPGNAGNEMKVWPPAIHNRFDDKHPDNPSFTNLGVPIERDVNGLRKDRVKASRWYNVKTKATQDTKPENTTDWQLQLQVKFRGPEFYGDKDDWVAQEKAALFNTLIMHDYMVLYGPTPASGKEFPASYSTQVADNYGDDVGKGRAQPMYFCSGHHQSNLKFDVGIGAKSIPTNRSDYSRAFHAFHGKMQVYKNDVSASDSADGQAHSKGELIRNERGHPIMFGGRGWDEQFNDDNKLPLTASDSTKPEVLDKPTVPTWLAEKNNWRPDLFPMHTQGELMLQFGEKVAMENNCVKCHTGATEKSYRDVHHAAGMKCDNCHGDMLAVGMVYQHEGYNVNLSMAGGAGPDTAGKLEPTDFRRPWLDEPDCGSCHIGDANIKANSDVKFGSEHNNHGRVDTGGKYGLETLYSAGALKQGWLTGDKAGRSMDPINARFAVTPVLEQRPEKTTTGYANQPLSAALFRKSYDVHSAGVNQLTCSSCHGGSHAIWPNQNPDANDNQTAKQLQGYDGNIVECSVCHVKDDFKTGLVATNGGESGLGVGQGVREGTVVSAASTTNGKAFLAGPHGMHPVGDEYWYKNADGAAANTSKGKKKAGLNGGWHNDMAKMAGPDGEDQCAACHGANHKGTRLSRTLVDRVLTNDKGKPIQVKAGTIIGCNTCHTLKKSFTDAPNPKAVDGGWPKAKAHRPPMMEIPTPTGGGGGGGHH